MKIDISNLFNGDDKSVSINYNLPLDDLVYSTYNPIKKGANIKGSVYQTANVVHLEADVAFDFTGYCDRCAEQVNRVMNFSLNKILVPQLANDVDYDDYIVVEGGILDLDELITEEIQLFLPSKLLCRPDCKGLCQSCGKNLNFGNCGCRKNIDPRMEALLQLLDEE